MIFIGFHAGMNKDELFETLSQRGPRCGMNLACEVSPLRRGSRLFGRLGRRGAHHHARGDHHQEAQGASDAEIYAGFASEMAVSVDVYRFLRLRSMV